MGVVPVESNEAYGRKIIDKEEKTPSSVLKEKFYCGRARTSYLYSIISKIETRPLHVSALSFFQGLSD